MHVVIVLIFGKLKGLVLHSCLSACLPVFLSVLTSLFVYSGEYLSSNLSFFQAVESNKDRPCIYTVTRRS